MTLISDTGIFTKNEWVELINDLSLSPRQADVTKQLLSGRSDKQIAMKLQIAVPTIRTHLNRIFSRLDVQDRNELVLHVFRHFREGCRAIKEQCPRKQRR